MPEARALTRTAISMGLHDVERGAEGVIDGQRVSLSFAYDDSGQASAIVRGWLGRLLDLCLDGWR